MVQVEFRKLKAGDTIVCPVSGLQEKVTTSKRYTGLRWFVRTSRHDHMRDQDELVERV